MIYNFDEIIDRSGNHSAKYDERMKKFGTNDVLPLWIADMDFRTAQPIIDALTARAQEGLWGYTNRHAGYFEAIAGWQKRRNGWDIDTAFMSWSLGVVQTISAMVHICVPAGGNVLIQTPVYSEFYDMVELAGRSVLENQFVERDGVWSVDWADFEEKLQRSDLFLLCNPHNPLGMVWEAADLKRMVDLCIRYHVPVLSDEIHSDLIFHGKKHTPTATVSEEAKNYVVTAISGTKTFNHGEEWLDQLLPYISANFDFVVDYCRRHIPQIKTYAPDATYLMWLDCRELGLDNEALRRFMIDKAKLGLNEGWSFGRSLNGFMRLNAACPRSVLEQAMQQLEAAVKSL